MKRIFLLVLLLAFGSTLFAQQNILGFWKTVDKKEGFTTSIIAVYEYNGKLYGQVIAGFDEDTGELIDTIYNPLQHIDGKEDEPLICLSTLFWNLVKKGDKYKKGKIIDPRSGIKVSCSIWVEDGNMIIRGNVLFIAKSQICYPVTEDDLPPGFILPDLDSLVPSIPD